MVTVNYHLTPEPNAAQIKSLTLDTITAEDRAATRASWGAAEVLASLLVLACILGAYIYFRGPQLRRDPNARHVKTRGSLSLITSRSSGVWAARSFARSCWPR